MMIKCLRTRSFRAIESLYPGKVRDFDNSISDIRAALMNAARNAKGTNREWKLIHTIR